MPYAELVVDNSMGKLTVTPPEETYGIINRYQELTASNIKTLSNATSVEPSAEARSFLQRAQQTCVGHGVQQTKLEHTAECF